MVCFQHPFGMFRRTTCAGVMLCAMQPHSLMLVFRCFLKPLHAFTLDAWCYSIQKYWKQVFASTTVFHWCSVKEFLFGNQHNWICLLKVSLQAKASHTPALFFFFQTSASEPKQMQNKHEICYFVTFVLIKFQVC